MQIKWDDLGQVAEVSFAFGVGIVVVFTLGVLGLGRRNEGRRDDGRRDESRRYQDGGARARAVALSGAVVAFALCAAAVAYGLYLLIPQFH